MAWLALLQPNVKCWTPLELASFPGPAQRRKGWWGLGTRLTGAWLLFFECCSLNSNTVINIWILACLPWTLEMWCNIFGVHPDIIKPARKTYLLLFFVYFSFVYFVLSIQYFAVVYHALLSFKSFDVRACLVWKWFINTLAIFACTLCDASRCSVKKYLKYLKTKKKIG